MNYALRLATALSLAAALAGCNSIGEGSTIETLEILPATSNTQLKSFESGDTYKLFECLRDELVVKATFTDGAEANFSGRVTWTSSDPSVVEVSNGDLGAAFLLGNPANDGTFYESTSVKYVAGTVIPRGTAGQSAVITAKFSKLRASLNVTIRKPSLRIVSAPNPAAGSAAPPYYLAQGTTQRLSALVNVDGRTLKGSDLNGIANGFNINPLRWVFTGGTFVPRDPNVLGQPDRWVIEGGADRIATLHVVGADGVVTGVEADFLPYEVTAETSLCPGSADPALRPSAEVQVATLYDDPGTAEDDRLVLTRQPGFNGDGFAVEDLVAGTGEQMQLRAKVDAFGNGSLIVDQHMNTQASYRVLPLEGACENADELIGCASNVAFSASGALVSAVAGTADGTVARVQACTPLCLPPRATLEADATTVGTGVPVNFTAAAYNAPPGVSVQYRFDFGDGTTLGPQASPLASHAYAVAGSYTATVRLADAAFPAEFLSQNAGAVRVLAGVTPPAGNNAPTARLIVSDTGGDAPLEVTLDAATSTDSDSGDSITVYEFDPGDGSPVIRQSRPSLRHAYLDGTGGPFTPTVRVYDESAVASTVVAGTEIAVNGVAPEFIRSNVVDLRARKATLCSVELLPAPASAPTAAAFSFPAPNFDALGSFVADTDTDACTDPVIGSQLISRSVLWIVRPEGVTDETSLIAQIRAGADDFHPFGSVTWFRDVTEPTVLDVAAALQAPFDNKIIPTQTTLTVTPCTGCTP